ncbi:MAG: cyclopropane-fatty-acyl-phospholipid synthase family protein [Pseudomonadota bacterium]
MWDKLFDLFLTHLFRSGDLTVTYPDGKTKSYGDGKNGRVGIELKDPTLPRKLVLAPELSVGEAYMDGTLSIENDDLEAFLNICVRNFSNIEASWIRRPFNTTRMILKGLSQYNPMGRARRNVAHHYDLSGDLYDLFLDKDRQYSCAYFEHPGMPLDDAQNAKKHHIARKLLIQPGMRILDIGCGWGGLGLTLAKDYGANVLGVTLSEEQHKVAVARASEAGLADRARFEMIDYRKVEGTFDRIVSVGMFEHVGTPHYDEYFRSVKKLLKEDGVALIHTIGHVGPPDTMNPWMEKYIFPGAYAPALSEITKAVDKHRLVTCDIEALRLHYSYTLNAWKDRTIANRSDIERLYDERFFRMWMFYLVAMEQSFNVGNLLVYQLQLGKALENVVPITRAYLHDETRQDEGSRERTAAE